MSDILHTIDACNGEIRIKSCRYESGWYCLIVPVEQSDEVWERWDDLTCGDKDYFDAKAYFAKKDDVYIATGPSPLVAITRAMDAAFMNGGHGFVSRTETIP